MIITPLRVSLISAITHLIELGAPYLWPRTSSDYWLYATLFSSSCPVALDGDTVIGAVIAFRSQDDPADVYVQDVISHPHHRRTGVARTLLNTVHQQATAWGCERVYLTSEPDNAAAHHTWRSLGYTNVPGNQTINGVSVTSDYKGPGKHRAIYQLKTPLRFVS
jgi:GNAT superfamily N-acetyltransferase